MSEDKKSVEKTQNVRKKQTFTKPKGNFWSVVKSVWHYIYTFRSIIISLPVLAIAIGEAFRNATRLPEMVGLNIQATGAYGMTVTRATAVVAPLLITIGCILLTCFSKRTLFPWLISIFTLVLPVLIWITNIYPA